jgi:hypothetical protein
VHVCVCACVCMCMLTCVQAYVCVFVQDALMWDSHILSWSGGLSGWTAYSAMFRVTWFVHIFRSSSVQSHVATHFYDTRPHTTHIYDTPPHHTHLRYPTTPHTSMIPHHTTHIYDTPHHTHLRYPTTTTHIYDTPPHHTHLRYPTTHSGTQLRCLHLICHNFSSQIMTIYII